ncbi:type 1 glutamine amidotransferase [Carpediemonas membranifera]|uniref:Type 1 glutamine amidotransferase n=1 Tax=Carpediemonas membranifera TaxID=201153 RepID=A0A8J6B3M8_9EUKA|nr:type 1 glutamine amidotransferase [Carpediemonas membranifera]|eukprot:KAG9392252.1 type 1 glutamine amidotransferase [Carpediemonas membranifera]
MMRTALLLTVIAVGMCLTATNSLPVYPPEPVYPAFPFPRIEEYNEIVNWPWGTVDMTQPPVSSPTEFSGLNVAILAASGAEDVEFIYPYIFFKARGANVEVIGVEWQQKVGVQISDWIKPTYVVDITRTCKDVHVQQRKYDVIAIVGGSWSSAVMRNDPDCTAIVRDAVHGGNTIVAPICSGNEVLVNTGLLAESHCDITGSPFSGDILTLAGGNFKGSELVVIPAQYKGMLISGNGPAAMFKWVQAIRQAIIDHR